MGPDAIVPPNTAKGICPDCQGRGYTFMIARWGLLSPCRCKKGKEVEAQLDSKVQDVRTCRKFSRDGVFNARVE